jgi:hypothetical protein
VLVWIRHIVINSAGHRRRDVGVDHHLHHDSGDNVDQPLDHDNVGADIDKYLDDYHCRSIVRYRDSRHRPVGARTRHHRVSHG